MSEYDDILHLPHHQSQRHLQMPLLDRAAQFAPFAALAGHSDVIANTAQNHIDDVNAPQFEQDYLLSLLAPDADTSDAG